MGKTAQEYLSVMQSWVGKSEANGGHKEIIDLYNSQKPLPRGYAVQYNDEWCDTTISAAAIKAGMTDLIGRECSCQRHIDIFKEKGIWIEDGTITPKVAYIIVYNWDDGTQPNDGWADHIGVVEKVVNGVITVIEGNKGGKVDRRTIKVGHGQIRGYAAPKYEEPKKTTTAAKKSVTEVAQDVIDGKYGTGAARKANLKAAGYDYDTVQAKVNELLEKANTKKYYAKYTGSSSKIDEVFKAVGVPSKYIKDKDGEKYSVRKPVAAANGISNYTGSASQNTTLINLAKKGKLKKA